MVRWGGGGGGGEEFSTSGDILSTSGDVQYIRDTMSTQGDV